MPQTIRTHSVRHALSGARHTLTISSGQSISIDNGADARMC
jgi:hypothetical protein